MVNLHYIFLFRLTVKNMTINEYVKKWCDEDYDIRKEDFFIKNAYYVAQREWGVGGLKHGIAALIIAGLLSFVINASEIISYNILEFFVNLGIFTACFYLYAVKEYDENDTGVSIVSYIMLAVLLFIAKGKVNDTIKVLYSIIMFLMYIYVSVVNPIRLLFIKKAIKEDMLREEGEEYKNAQQNYSSWENEYKAHRYGLPQAEMSRDDPIMIEARKLFDGYKESKQMLKTRYRQLAKQYHPDKGGDTKLFQYIVSVYEEESEKMS
jgi:hypothetical protein